MSMHMSFQLLARGVRALVEALGQSVVAKAVL
jgi:hypothetical protein